MTINRIQNIHFSLSFILSLTNSLPIWPIIPVLVISIDTVKQSSDTKERYNSIYHPIKKGRCDFFLNAMGIDRLVNIFTRNENSIIWLLSTFYLFDKTSQAISNCTYSSCSHSRHPHPSSPWLDQRGQQYQYYYDD